MNEREELLKDYNDCNNYLNNIDNYDYNEISNWALNKYTYWISKNEKYVLVTTLGNVPPKDNREKAINSLNNLKSFFERILIIKNINF